MPSVSAKQARAMHAAAAGKSTLGIPRKVGREFVKADKRKRNRKAAKHIRRKLTKRKRKHAKT